jgi:hypothetical protein
MKCSRAVRKRNDLNFWRPHRIRRRLLRWRRSQSSWIGGAIPLLFARSALDPVVFRLLALTSDDALAFQLLAQSGSQVALHPHPNQGQEPARISDFASRKRPNIRALRVRLQWEKIR